MIKTAVAATLAAGFTFSAPATAQFTSTPKSADDVGLYLGAQMWQSQPRGIFGEETTRLDFGLKKDQQMNYFLEVKNPFDLLPHARMAYTRLNSGGATTLTQAFRFNDKTFALGQPVNTRLNLSYVDFTLYYELLEDDNFSFALGFTARNLRGDVSVMRAAQSSDDSCYDPNPAPDSPCTDSGNNAMSSGSIKTTAVKPLLFAASHMELPFEHVSLFIQADVSFLNDHTLFDYQVGFNYDLKQIIFVDFKANLGYRAVNMEFDNLNKLATDVKFEGVFVGVTAHF